ncbi:MAG: acyltransferase [Alphaproteobacteria bacterium]|nr:MAG: acyltransferase [Alphaproteobacteria bacterium]
MRNLAGDKVFARGLSYYHGDAVELLGISDARVTATVAGTEDYRTVVTGQGNRIGGECSCPAFADWGFCKHMVATALAANEAGATGGLDDGVARIRAHLKSKGIEALIDMILDLAEQDRALLRRLEMSAALTETDEAALKKRLRRLIGDATRIRGFIDYERAPGWAAGVDAALDALAELADGPHAALAIELSREAASRIEQAIENMDDSDGYCSELLARAADIHLAACKVARPEPVKLARDLYELEMADGYGAFEDTVRRYADILGQEGLAEYRRLATQAWEALPARTASRRSEFGYNPEHRKLASILDFFAERDGDVDLRIALRAKDLSSQWDYLQLAEFCLAQGRAEEALTRAEEGLWLFEDDRPDERLVFFAAGLLEKAGRRAEAEAHLWRAFGKAPSMDLYRRLRRLGGKAATGRAIDLLMGRLAQAPASRWHHPSDLVLRMLMAEKQLDAAWRVFRAHGASRGTAEALARASETTHPKDALEIYARRVEELARTGGNPAYEEAVALIDRMAGLQAPGEHAAYLAGVRERYRRKRNLMKLLG